MDGSPPNYSRKTIEPAPIEMNAARHSVVVKASIGQGYERWARFEDFPKFITPLRNIQRIDDAHFSFIWHPNGNEQRGVFHILLRVPERRIAWRSTSDGFMSGVVSFEPRSNEDTEVTLKRFFHSSRFRIGSLDSSCSSWSLVCRSLSSLPGPSK